MSESTGETPPIFINYRRSESLEAARRLEQALKEHFGERSVFRDESTPAGEEFPIHLKARVGGSRVMLALICSDWHRLREEATGKRRLDAQGDWIRCELEIARLRGACVIPVLLEGAAQPAAEWELPEEISFLPELQCLPLRNSRWDSDFEVLQRRLERLLHTPLQFYREVILKQHAHLNPLFSVDDPRLLESVYVEVLVAGARQRWGAPRQTLEGLLAMPPSTHGGTGRWAILGDPGAGKTTIARRLAWKLASEGEGARAVGAYVSLPQWAATQGLDVFDFIEGEICEVDSERGKGLGNALRYLAGQDGRLWLLLDGLDEVDDGLIGRLRDRTRVLVESSDYAGARVAVLSRVTGYRERSIGVPAATLMELDGLRRRELLGKWIGAEEAERVLADLSMSVERMLSNPLALTLVALLARVEPGQSVVPRTRVRLFSEVISVLLARGHGVAREGGVDDPEGAHRILRSLALALQTSEVPRWSYAELYEYLLRIRRAEEDVNDCLRSWKSPKKFLDDIAYTSGILTPQVDGWWAFWHRQFREFLSAEALGAMTPSRRGEVLSGVDIKSNALGAADGRNRWAEVVGMMTSLSDDPESVLEELGEVIGDRGIQRILPELEGLAADRALATLLGTEWDGEQIERLARGWVDHGLLDADGVVQALWPLIVPEQSIERLGQVHYAMAQAGAAPSRESFFAACGRPIKNAEDVPEFVVIPGGSCCLGSPPHEQGRRENEHRREAVEIETFEIARTAVTNGQYSKFDPTHVAEDFDARVPTVDLPDHPVVNVSWWGAYLYCEWIGAKLPTEQQWEYACRAGTTTAFSFGHGIRPDQVNYNGRFPLSGAEGGLYRGSTVKVASLPANQWGIYEMHGNVDEWCCDRPDSSSGGPAGLERAVRGGCWVGVADLCRSASRRSAPAHHRYGRLGFRPVRATPEPAVLPQARDSG